MEHFFFVFGKLTILKQLLLINKCFSFLFRKYETPQFEL